MNSQLLAFARPGVAELAEAVELVGQHFGDGRRAPLVGPCRIARRHPGVVEMLVAQQRPIVAGHAIALADKQAQSAFLGGRQQIGGRRIAAQRRRGVGIEPRRPVRERAFVRRDRLAHVGEHPRDGQPLRFAQSASTPRVRPACRSDRHWPAGRRAPAWPGTAPRTRRDSAAARRAHTPAGCRHARWRLPAARAPATTGCPCGHPRTARDRGRCRPAASHAARPVPIPFDSASPSWNCLAGSWQLAHDTWPLPLRRASKNSRLPSAAAAGERSTAFERSAGAAGSWSICIDCSAARSLALQVSPASAGRASHDISRMPSSAPTQAFQAFISRSPPHRRCRSRDHGIEGHLVGADGGVDGQLHLPPAASC